MVHSQRINPLQTIDGRQNREDCVGARVIGRSHAAGMGEMIGDLADEGLKKKLLVELALAITSDYEIAPQERVILDKVAVALGAPIDELDAILEVAKPSS